MGINYTTGTVNQPDAGSVGQAMAEKIRDDVVAHAAWDLVEEYFPASGQARYYVFKCLAAESGLPADFFVVMSRTLSNGELRFAICETYSAAGHQMQHFGHWPTSGVTYDAEGRNPATYVLPATGFGNAANQPRYVYWIPSGTSTKWWITVAEDGFTVAFNGAANGFVHAGAYIPLTQLPILMPIQIIGYSDSNGVITRNPAVAGVVNPYSQALTIDGGGNVNPSGVPLGFQGFYRYNDKLQNNQRPVAEQGIVMSAQSGQGDWPQVYGYVLGKQKRMRYSNQATPAGFAFGDAYALNGKLWVPFLPTDGRIWDTGVPSS